MEFQMILVLIILITTIVMLIFEVFRIDIIAILCMLVLGWSGILTPNEMFSGFSSTAVIAMISVMILGRGLSQSGIMDKLVILITRYSSSNKGKLIAFVSVLTGGLSAFVQNIGAAALFLPPVLKISKKEAFRLRN